jgi:hypothetical protein
VLSASHLAFGESLAAGERSGEGEEGAEQVGVVFVAEHAEPSAALATVNDALLHHETNRFFTVALVRLSTLTASG